MGYVAWSVVFGEQPSAAKWNILGQNDASFNDGSGILAGAITPEKLTSGTGSAWAWQSWTPTWTNLTIGNATQDCKYIQAGKTIIARGRIVLGSTSSVGTNAYFSLPVTPHAGYTSGADDFHMVGESNCSDASANIYCCGAVSIGSIGAGSGLFIIYTANFNHVTLSGTSSTSPFTWANGDILNFSIIYEAA